MKSTQAFLSFREQIELVPNEKRARRREKPDEGSAMRTARRVYRSQRRHFYHFAPATTIPLAI